MLPAGRGPPYQDITEHIKDIAYGPNGDTRLWYTLEHTTVEKLRQKCFYHLRDGKVIGGELQSIQSCTSAPRVLINIQTTNGKTEYLDGRLFGTPENLGVTLDKVVEIK